MERTLAWISHCRRLAHDYERHARKPAAFVRLAMIRLMLRRLKGNPFPEPLLQLTKGLLKEGIFIFATRSNMWCSAMADVYTRPLAEVERAYILQVLHDCYGNRTRAAKLLGISIRGLRIKLSDFANEGFSVPAPHRSGGGDQWSSFRQLRPFPRSGTGCRGKTAGLAC